MSESRDHKCPRCGSYLPTVTVQKPVYEELRLGEGGGAAMFITSYKETEEVADCVRCTGGY